MFPLTLNTGICWPSSSFKKTSWRRHLRETKRTVSLLTFTKAKDMVRGKKKEDRKKKKKSSCFLNNVLKVLTTIVYWGYVDITFYHCITGSHCLTSITVKASWTKSEWQVNGRGTRKETKQLIPHFLIHSNLQFLAGTQPAPSLSPGSGVSEPRGNQVGAAWGLPAPFVLEN